jgi:membrane protease YdiL (CAAX protease family)
VELRADSSAGGIAIGLVLGIILFSSLMGILWLAGAYRPAGWTHWQPLPLALLSALAGAVFEEVIFRGFLFRLVAGLGGNWTALGVTSALFGLAHFFNPAATWASSLAIAIEAGNTVGRGIRRQRVPLAAESGSTPAGVRHLALRARSFLMRRSVQGFEI